ncbi:MAG TPA: GYD domain-containing protein [Thermoplasmata archaeon]|nr:GYD domain-containing protein [Thermoplasmata archaeon]
MPNYITLGNWTEQGIKTVKESPKRADAVTALANKLGAKMQIFYTMGRYDIVALTEAPNDDVAMQLLLEIGKLGNVKTQTLKAWTASEATKVISKVSP